MYSFKTEDFLHRIAIGLENALNMSELAEPLAAFGYNKKRLQEGLELRKSVVSLQAEQVKVRSLAKEATATFQQAREGLEQLYRRHVAIARLALTGNSEAFKKLQLDGKRKRTISGTQLQAKLFYTHLNEYMAVVERYGISSSEAQESIKLLNNLVELQTLQQRAKSQSLTLTQMKNGALDNLVIWWRRFNKTAQLVFENQPRYLEILQLTT